MTNKISALESFKISVLLEDFTQKLAFLDQLKANMGEEMSEQMSEEITKAMDEQRALEQRYAMLVTRRGQLKGLSHKKELQDTKEQILLVSKELKNSTRKLGRQLHDNPDVGGNQKLIKNYKTELVVQLENLMKEMEETQSYNDFKILVDKGNQDQEQYEKLRQEEKKLQEDIRKVTEDHKSKQDAFAADAQQSLDDISRLKKAVNETKLESELQIQYQKRVIEGRLQCIQRLNSKIETDMKNKIEDLKQKIKIEQEVSEKIKKFVILKKGLIEKMAFDRDYLREQKLVKLNREKEDILGKRELAEHAMQEMKMKCDEQEEEKRIRDQEDAEVAAKEQAKIQEKMDMDKAAKYIQARWAWFQVEGKLLAKKRKGKKGGKKGKKKK